eukprot:2756443-Rhodomonas_salina.3
MRLPDLQGVLWEPNGGEVLPLSSYALAMQLSQYADLYSPTRPSGTDIAYDGYPPTTRSSLCEVRYCHSAWCTATLLRTLCATSGTELACGPV